MAPPRWLVIILCAWAGWVIRRPNYDPCSKFPLVSESESQNLVAVVTGSAGGLGLTLAERFAQLGVGKIYVTARSKEKAEDAVKSLEAKNTFPSSTLIPEELDLNDLASVVRFAKEFSLSNSKLDILVNNGAIVRSPYGETANGFESQVGINHLSHYLLTRLLIPKMLESTYGPRIIHVSSQSADFGRVRPAKWRYSPFGDEERTPGQRYGDSKISQVAFSQALAHKLSLVTTKGTSNSLHPGIVVTDAARHVVPAEISFLIPFLGGALTFLGILDSPKAAITTQLALALSPDFGSISGGFLHKCSPRRSKSNILLDTELPQLVWDASHFYIDPDSKILGHNLEVKPVDEWDAYTPPKEITSFEDFDFGSRFGEWRKSVVPSQPTSKSNVILSSANSPLNSSSICPECPTSEGQNCPHQNCAECPSDPMCSQELARLQQSYLREEGCKSDLEASRVREDELRNQLQVAPSNHDLIKCRDEVRVLNATVADLTRQLKYEKYPPQPSSYDGNQASINATQQQCERELKEAKEKLVNITSAAVSSKPKAKCTKDLEDARAELDRYQALNLKHQADHVALKELLNKCQDDATENTLKRETLQAEVQGLKSSREQDQKSERDGAKAAELKLAFEASKAECEILVNQARKECDSSVLDAKKECEAEIAKLKRVYEDAFKDCESARNQLEVKLTAMEVEKDEHEKGIVAKMATLHSELLASQQRLSSVENELNTTRSEFDATRLDLTQEIEALEVALAEEQSSVEELEGLRSKLDQDLAQCDKAKKKLNQSLQQAQQKCNREKLVIREEIAQEMQQNDAAECEQAKELIKVETVAELKRQAEPVEIEAREELDRAKEKIAALISDDSAVDVLKKEIPDDSNDNSPNLVDDMGESHEAISEEVDDTAMLEKDL